VRWLLMRRIAAALAMAVALVTAGGASAEVSQLRISRGFGMHYLPLYVMEAKGLVPKRAADWLGGVKVQFLLIEQLHAPGRPAQGQTSDLERCVRERVAWPAGQLIRLISGRIAR
jgi:hypothetical protein